jgi:purine-binding chemotaxis protein CheW
MNLSPTRADASIADESVLTCEPIEQLVVFHIGEQRYAFPLSDVQEIQQIVQMAEVPDAHVGVLGMVNLRGRVIPAIDLNARLGVASGTRGLDTPMVVVRHHDGLVALVVDAVDDVLGIATGCIQPAPPLHPLESVMHGVARLEDGLVYVLDSSRLIDAEVTLS